MIVSGTPIEHHPEYGLWVKREDLCCPGGPNFSKTRGVFSHVKARPEKVVGVLDTAHSQGGWAVARASALLGKQCLVFYPRRKHEDQTFLKPQQQACLDLGAQLVPLQAGRSAVLYHTAKKQLPVGGYMMPNALKLLETVEETAKEYINTPLPDDVKLVVVSASSGTIAAGVLRGMVLSKCRRKLLVHLGYDRPASAVSRYLEKMSGVCPLGRVELISEGYAYADEAVDGATPPWPCNSYYDLKAFRWWLATGRAQHGSAIFWNIG